MSRSPAIVAAALARTESMTFEDAVKRVAASGPCDMSPALVASVSRWCSRTEEFR